MTETRIVRSGETIIGVHSWTEGFRPLKPPRYTFSSDDIRARCKYLVRRGYTEEAEELAERLSLSSSVH